MTCAKSTRGAPTWAPSAASARTSPTACADRSSALDGTHPVFRQSPPSRARSTRATRAPRPAAPIAATRPAVPPPTTTRSYFGAGVGLVQWDGRTARRRASFASSAGRFMDVSLNRLRAGIVFVGPGEKVTLSRATIRQACLIAQTGSADGAGAAAPGGLAGDWVATGVPSQSACAIAPIWSRHSPGRPCWRRRAGRPSSGACGEATRPSTPTSTIGWSRACAMPTASRCGPWRGRAPSSSTPWSSNARRRRGGPGTTSLMWINGDTFAQLRRERLLAGPWSQSPAERPARGRGVANHQSGLRAGPVRVRVAVGDGAVRPDLRPGADAVAAPHRAGPGGLDPRASWPVHARPAVHGHHLPEGAHVRACRVASAHSRVGSTRRDTSPAAIGCSPGCRPWSLSSGGEGAPIRPTWRRCIACLRTARSTSRCPTTRTKS